MSLGRHRASLAWTALGLLVLLAHALAAAAGWDEAASALSGTPTPGASPLLGAAYVALRLLAYVVAPALLLAAALRPLLLAALRPRGRAP